MTKQTKSQRLSKSLTEGGDFSLHERSLKFEAASHILAQEAAMATVKEALDAAQRWHNGDKWRNGSDKERDGWHAHKQTLESALAIIKETL